MGFEKDYVAILSVLWDIGSTIENYVVSPNETTYIALRRSGLTSPFAVNLNDDDGALDWDGTGLDPIFKVPLDSDSVDVNTHYLASMFR